MKRNLRRLAAILLFVIPVSVFAQEGDSKQGKHEKEAARRKEEQQKMQEEAIERGRKRQMDIQTKETRKRMKRNQKKARKFNEGKEEFFLIKIFRRKKH